MWVMLFCGHSLKMIKCNWEKFFPKIAKRLTPTIKDKKLTCSNSPLILWIERKYNIESIPMKSSNKNLVFLVSKRLKDNTNDSLKNS